jgi:GTP-binding protein Era
MEAVVGTALTPQQRLGEILREKLFLNLHAEVPYSVAQRLRGWRHIPASQSRDGVASLVVDVDLIVPRPSVVAMLRARGNGPLKAIKAAAEGDASAALGVRTELFMHPVVRKARRAHDADTAADAAAFVQ